MLLEISGTWAAKVVRKAKARARWLSACPELGPHLALGLFSPHFDLRLVAVKTMKTLIESHGQTPGLNKQRGVSSHTHVIIYLTCATLCHRTLQRLKSLMSSESNDTSLWRGKSSWRGNLLSAIECRDTTCGFLSIFPGTGRVLQRSTCKHWVYNYIL